MTKLIPKRRCFMVFGHEENPKTEVTLKIVKQLSHFLKITCIFERKQERKDYGRYLFTINSY